MRQDCCVAIPRSERNVSSSPSQTCSVVNGSGTVGSRGVFDIVIFCRNVIRYVVPGGAGPQLDRLLRCEGLTDPPRTRNR